MLVLLLTTVFQAQDWWNSDWSSRRPVTLTNRADHELAAGSPITVDVSSLKDKLTASELVLVHNGKRQPFLVEEREGRIVVQFRTAAAIAKGKADPSYAIYYGNASAPANATKAAELHEYFADFSGDSLAADAGIKSAVEKGQLIVTDVGAEKTELNPARIVLTKVAPKGAFSLSVDFDVTLKEGAQVIAGLAIVIKDDVAADEAVLKRVRAALDALSDSDWETRETATKELIKIGRPALEKARDAAKSTDAEVKWRAEHVVERILFDHPPKLVTATFNSDDVKMRASRTVVIGGRKMQYPASLVMPGRVTIRVDRDEDGEVTITWNGVKRDEGEMKGEVKEIALVFCKGVAGSFGRAAIDRVAMSKHLSEDDRPSVTIETEQKQK